MPNHLEGILIQDGRLGSEHMRLRGWSLVLHHQHGPWSLCSSSVQPFLPQGNMPHESVLQVEAAWIHDLRGHQIILA